MFSKPPEQLSKTNTCYRITDLPADFIARCDNESISPHDRSRFTRVPVDDFSLLQGVDLRSFINAECNLSGCCRMDPQYKAWPQLKELIELNRLNDLNIICSSIKEGYVLFAVMDRLVNFLTLAKNEAVADVVRNATEVIQRLNSYLGDLEEKYRRNPNDSALPVGFAELMKETKNCSPEDRREALTFAYPFAPGDTSASILPESVLVDSSYAKSHRV